MAKKNKKQYRMLTVREAVALVNAGVKGIEVDDGGTWIYPSNLYRFKEHDEHYFYINEGNVYRVEVE